MIGIVIITFNTPSFFTKQIELIQRFCTDDYEIIIVDNSDDKEKYDSIKYHAKRLGCKFRKVSSADGDASHSHSFAANFAYSDNRNYYKYLSFWDHDLFPTKPFSLREMIGDAHIMGLEQIRMKVKYLWPGFLTMTTDIEIIDPNKVDFTPRKIDGVMTDTGGGMAPMLKNIADANKVLLPEIHKHNTTFKGKDNFYAEIAGHFVHFINGSNWKRAKKQQERINSLLNILETRINEN